MFLRPIHSISFRGSQAAPSRFVAQVGPSVPHSGVFVAKWRAWALHGHSFSSRHPAVRAGCVERVARVFAKQKCLTSSNRRPASVAVGKLEYRINVVDRPFIFGSHPYTDGFDPSRREHEGSICGGTYLTRAPLPTCEVTVANIELIQHTFARHGEPVQGQHLPCVYPGSKTFFLAHTFHQQVIGYQTYSRRN